jgi:hypothetical protein
VVPAVVKARPELAKAEPVETVLPGNREAMAKFKIVDLTGLHHRQRVQRQGAGG